MSLVYSFGWWTTLFWVAIGIVASLFVCVLACAWRRRRLAQTAALLGGMPLPELPPLPGLDMPPRDDPLEAVEGIGPVIADLLRAEGVRTFDGLAQRGVARVRAFLRELGPERVGPADPASWAVQALWLARGQFEAFASLVQKLDDGRVPLESVCEPPEAWRPPRDEAIRLAAALRAAGVHSVEKLAEHSDAAALARALRGADVSPARVAGWIEQAILFQRGDEAAYRSLLDPRIVARMGAVAAPFPLTGEYQADLDRRTVAFSQAVVAEFDAATTRWREGALALLGRESDRTCLACRWIALLAALAFVALLWLWIVGKRPSCCSCCSVRNAPAPVVAVAARPVPPVDVVLPRVLFPFARSDLEPAADYRIGEIVRMVKERADHDHETLRSLVVTGHADISGQYGVPRPYPLNRPLADARGDAVAARLRQGLAGVLPPAAITVARTPPFVVEPSSRHCVLHNGFADTPQRQRCLAEDRNAVVTATFDVRPAPTAAPTPAPSPPPCGVAFCEHPDADGPPGNPAGRCAR